MSWGPVEWICWTVLLGTVAVLLGDAVAGTLALRP